MSTIKSGQAVQTLTTAEQLLYSVIRIRTSRGGQQRSVGTGFIYNVKVANDVYVHLLITNRHVIEGADSISIVFHRLDRSGPRPSGELVTCTLDYEDSALIMHPDKSVDLCAIPITTIMVGADKQNKPIFFIALSRDIIPTREQWDNFDAIEDVMMIGCPRGIYDEVNNIPIMRRGISATPLSKDYNGKREFVVDIACFPGSSGSPVIMCNNDTFLDKSTNAYIMGQGRVYLLGILYSGPIIDNAGEIILGTSPRVRVESMMHLGYAIKSTALLDVEAELLKRIPPSELLHGPSENPH